MPNLTKPYETFERPGLVVAYKLHAGTHIYKGAAVALNAEGYLVPLGPSTAGLRFVGVAGESVDNTGGASGAKTANVTKSGSFVMKAATGETPAAAQLGSVVYAASDWECQTTAGVLTNPYAVGTAVGLETTSTGVVGYRVRIDNHTV